MAKEAKPEAEVAVVAAPKKSKKLLVIIAAALVLVIAIAAVVFVVIKNNNAKADAEGDGSAEVVTTEKKKPATEAAPVYVALDAFTVNLVGDQFLQLVFSVEVVDAGTGDKLKTYMPKIRNNVMLLLSDKKASDLSTSEGKEALANAIRDLTNEVIEPGSAGGEGPIKEVLFTSFIIQ